MINVVKDGEIIPAKVVYVRNRNKRKENLWTSGCIYERITSIFENAIPSH